MTEEAVHHRDPILDPPRRRKGKGAFGLNNSTLLAIGTFIVALHALLFYYLYKQRFELELRQYSDESVEVELVEPIPPPPPLVVETVKKEDRVEYQGPPQITQSPPPPPAPPAPPRPSVITNPDWVSRPSGSDLARFYPPRAAEREIGGRVVLSCTVTESGSLSACSVQSEDPPGQGFGQASLRLTSRFRMRPQTRDGAPVGGARVTIPITWQLG